MQRWIFEIVILHRQKVIKYFNIGLLSNWQTSVPFQTSMGQDTFKNQKTRALVVGYPHDWIDYQRSRGREMQEWLGVVVFSSFHICALPQSYSHYLEYWWYAITCNAQEQENGDLQFCQKVTHCCSSLITRSALRDANPNLMTCFLLVLSSGADKGNWSMIVLQFQAAYSFWSLIYVSNLLKRTLNTAVRYSLSNTHIYVWRGVFVIYCVSTYFKSLKQGGSASC